MVANRRADSDPGGRQRVRINQPTVSLLGPPYRRHGCRKGIQSGRAAIVGNNTSSLTGPYRYIESHDSGTATDDAEQLIEPSQHTTVVKAPCQAK
ncbi:hypothetical protein Aau02nite_49080 [Amorphoplanes auranticolor]|uniref:Uncharacterized protein n=1 Tax=Actinoplanes auranticolor TaxID=47988 RepID=A0A919SI20_9ACTN|nr:hypothetical protein Aau02nite_49080 [Actinoplanes auranticolor]